MVKKKAVHESICKAVLNAWCDTPQLKDYEVRNGKLSIKK